MGSGVEKQKDGRRYGSCMDRQMDGGVGHARQVKADFDISVHIVRPL